MLNLINQMLNSINQMLNSINQTIIKVYIITINKIKCLKDTIININLTKVIITITPKITDKNDYENCLIVFILIFGLIILIN
jgi:hypothetical protein